jgi:23S rRNA pseudouridine2605 synthase
MILGTPDDRDLDRMRRGLVIDGKRTLPAEVRVNTRGGRSASREKPTTMLQITIREGRNRQVRKMCEAIGHPVERLTRTAIGPIRDSRLRPGHWRELDAEEIDALRRASRQ